LVNVDGNADYFNLRSLAFDFSSLVVLVSSSSFADTTDLTNGSSASYADTAGFDSYCRACRLPD
jgi:hypothetical protein